MRFETCINLQPFVQINTEDLLSYLEIYWFQGYANDYDC